MIKPETLRMILVAVVLCGAFWAGYGLGTNKNQVEIDATHERGFEEGREQKDYGFALAYVQGAFDIVFPLDQRLHGLGHQPPNIYRLAWKHTMAVLFGKEPYYVQLRSVIDSLFALPLFPDSTDIMPAVDSATKKEE